MSQEPLCPLFVAGMARSGSTLTMQLLSTASEVAVETTYPLESRYLQYFRALSRMLNRRDWDPDVWRSTHLVELVQDRDTVPPMMGPLPWPKRTAIASRDGERPFADELFLVIWQAFSERARRLAGASEASPAQTVYWAEKCAMPWHLDLDGLLATKVLHLVRDPRDVWLSTLAFEQKRGRPAVGRQDATDAVFMQRFLRRVGRQLKRTIASLESPDSRLVRYEDLVVDLAGQAGRISAWLGIGLDPDALLRQRDIPDHHMTSKSVEASLGRWKREMSVEARNEFARALEPELERLGYEE